MKSEDIHDVITILREEYKHWQTPAVTIVAQCNGSPFKVLVSCIISLRTKDEVTALASARLFARAATPEEMMKLSEKDVSELIYPAGFYHTKSAQITALSQRLVDEYGGLVPDSIEELLTFKGVGRKTANLVVTLGFGKAGICVDTHVHRISNRLGYVDTKNPEETEWALRSKLPPEYWGDINDLLVAFGQNHCHPVSPRCSSCRLSPLCSRIGVKRTR
ncbi:MAG: endonuclease III [Desulfuromonadaceae bacterium]|nr:endonuclease III [Desulfuromonadaceae bacterium]MDD2856821.1 endonuclease III [Desulfuromonadaceae bacterium]